ncbi:MAG: sulfotransferase, partial [Acidimicrobiales bacterium]|nr:sulfotransferase [Acidimicrobiales bacterium]
MTQPILFIGGMGRSGSTLIERLLNEFPQTFAVGETVHIWERGVRDNELCGCGDPFHQCRFWTEVGRRAFGSWTEIDTDVVIDQRWEVDRSRRLPQMVQAYRSGNLTRAQLDYLDLVGALLTAAGATAKDRTGADIIIDSSKHLSSAVLYSLDERLDVRVVHVIRDPRGVAYSYTKSVERPEATQETVTEMAKYSPARTAGRWITDNAGFTQLPRLGIPTLRVRYEDFMADPLTTLSEIASFGG